MKLDYTEIIVLLTRLIPLEQDPGKLDNIRDKWEQEKLNSAIRKLESEATRMRAEKRL